MIKQVCRVNGSSSCVFHRKGIFHLRAVSPPESEYQGPELRELTSLERWEDIRKIFVERGGLRSVTRGNVKKLIETENYRCIDVRDGVHFNRGPRIEGSINIPLFTNEMSGSQAIVRKLLFSLLPSLEGGTYLNKNFINNVYQEVQSFEEPLVVVCGKGGSFISSKYFPNGIPSRSLIAAAILLKSGFKNIAHVKGGVSEKDEYESGVPWLLKFFYGYDVPVGSYSETLMYISFSIPFLILLVLLFPKIQAYLELTGFFI